MRLLIAALLTLVPLAASGGQRFQVEQGEETWQFAYAWHDGTGAVRSVDFALPAAAVLDDTGRGTRLPKGELYEHAAREVLAWARTIPDDDVEITALAEARSVILRASGPPDEAERALEEAKEVREQALAEWLDSHAFRRGRSGGVTFDHAELVVDYTDDVAPLAAELARMASGPRAFAELALSFVQSIPYERVRNGIESGYHRPLALLARNLGDCDSKVVLYLALIRAAHPEVPLAVVYVPGHALAGVGVVARYEDWAFVHRGVPYVFAEPVGPALLDLGRSGPETRQPDAALEVRAVAAATR